MCVCLLLVAFCFHSWFWHAGPYEARVHQDTKNIEGLGFTIGELRSYSDLHFNGHISFMDMKSSFSLHGDILVKIGRKLVDNVWGVFIALHCAVSTIWGVFPFHGFVCEWGQPLSETRFSRAIILSEWPTSGQSYMCKRLPVFMKSECSNFQACCVGHQIWVTNLPIKYDGQIRVSSNKTPCWSYSLLLNWYWFF